ncbi:MAG: hypothetical protein RJQ00_06075 [Vicingaceae bacterium]
MIAEDRVVIEYHPKITIPTKKVTQLIVNLMKETVPYFKNYLVSDNYTKSKLNEDDFTQIYIEQAQQVIRQNNYPFNVNGQYRDITYGSKGFSDFYFYPNEQNASTTSIFSVESKRLPAPAQTREKEYVIGDNNNGGIERYKTEKHGKSLAECGLLAFVEKEDATHWYKEVNQWITNLSTTEDEWSTEEVLKSSESRDNYSLFHSVGLRKEKAIGLTHLWVNVN